MQAAGPLMCGAARAFVASLTTEQRAQACFAFGDEERFRWHFTPVPRRGVTLRDLLPAQQKLAQALISSGYSPLGAVRANQIMSLEHVLHEIESERRFVRDPDLYFLTVFGEPADAGAWGWRLEGHHVSLNVTVVDGALASTTPSFFGANPAEVRQGPHAGLRILAPEEDLGRELVRSLGGAQRCAAVVAAEAPDDILTFNHRRAEWLGEAGLTADRLTVPQRVLLRTLIEAYAEPMPAEVAVSRLAAADATPAEELRFAWAGGVEPGERHYYRVQAPAFLIEFDNRQDGANHIHSVWRSFEGDWGLDALGAHLRSAHATAVPLS